MFDHQMLIKQITTLVEDVGREILPLWKSASLHIEEKNDTSPLTSADRLSHRLIVDRLKHFNLPIISEEGSLTSKQMLDCLNSSELVWLIDPLDGTKEFIAGRSEFAINIALVKKGRPVFGSVYCPVSRQLFIGSDDYGLLWIKDGNRCKVDTKPIKSSLTFAMSRSHQSHDVQLVNHLYPEATISPHGAALKYCYVAIGKADVTYRSTPTMAWDTAAPQAVVTAAGGRMTDLADQALRYGGKSLVNPPFVSTRRNLSHESVVENFRNAQERNEFGR